MINTNGGSSFVLFHHIYFSINLYPIIIHQFHSLDPTEESLASIHQTRYHEIQLTFEFQQGDVILQAQFLILQLSYGLHVECLKAGNLMQHQVITFCDEIGIHLLQALILLLQLLLPRADIQFVIH